MFKNKFWILLLAATFAALFLTAKVYAQDPAPTSAPIKAVSDNDVNLVAKKLYCPVCPNTPLDVCETQACKDWRAQIKDQLSQAVGRMRDPGLQRLARANQRSTFSGLDRAGRDGILRQTIRGAGAGGA